MQRFSIRRGAAALALAALAACDSPIEAPVRQPEDLAAMVEALGFRGDMVQDMGDYVLVEGDIRIPKADLRAAPRSASPADPLSGPRMQYTTTALVGSPRVHQITVNLTGLAAEPDWQNAARAALPLWSGIAGSYARIVEAAPGAPADITFALGCLPWNFAAEASWPSGGNPGSTITVNQVGCIGFGQNNQQRLHNMVHEIGHTLGFRHTNWAARNEQNDPLHGVIGAVHVPGTPGTGGDAGSVMNGGTALNAWAGFSAADLVAAAYLYPLPSASVTVTNSNGVPLVSWDPLPGATGYTVNFITGTRRVDTYGEKAVYSETSTPLGTTNGASLLDLASYTGVSQCSYQRINRQTGGTSTYTEIYSYDVRAHYTNGTSSARVAAPVAHPGCLIPW